MSLPNISNNAMWFAEKSAAKMGTCVLGQGIFVSCNRHQTIARAVIKSSTIAPNSNRTHCEETNHLRCDQNLLPFL